MSADAAGVRSARLAALPVSLRQLVVNVLSDMSNRDRGRFHIRQLRAVFDRRLIGLNREGGLTFRGTGPTARR